MRRRRGKGEGGVDGTACQTVKQQRQAEVVTQLLALIPTNKNDAHTLFPNTNTPTPERTRVTPEARLGEDLVAPEALGAKRALVAVTAVQVELPRNALLTAPHALQGSM